MTSYDKIQGERPLENIFKKGENADNQHFLLFPKCFQLLFLQCFQKSTPLSSLKIRIVW